MIARHGSEETQVGRAHAEEVAAHERACARAVRVVAGRCVDVDDCRELLGMLGLEKFAGLRVTDAADVPAIESVPGA